MINTVERGFIWDGRQKLMLYSLISILIFGADSKIKHEVERNLEPGSEKSACGGRLLIRKHHNKGIMLNLMDGHQKLTAAVSAGLTVFLVLHGIETFADRDRSKGEKLGFAFLIGGALSNTLDRITRGYVVDYVSFRVKWKKFQNIVFNISDFFIMAGACMTALFR
ncbi:MAG: signal peptidase II [Lachnospiraceae bacterium]